MALGKTARHAPPSSMHDIDDLYENNAFSDDEDALPVQPYQASKGGRAAQPHESAADTKKSTTTRRPNTASTTNKGAKVDFDVWVARKDKYERVAQTLAKLNTERASDDEQWLQVAVSLAATDVLLKTGKTDRCDCDGLCRDATHAVTKQRTRCQCPAKKCSLCKRCIKTEPGEITEKMTATLLPYKLEPSQSILELAGIIASSGVEGKPLPQSQSKNQRQKSTSGEGPPKLTAIGIRMANAVLSQCSVLENEDGTRIQRPCSCPLRSLGDLWVKWTTRHHTFSRTKLTTEQAMHFSDGTRKLMDYDEVTKTYYMTVKWTVAAKPQAGDTAKIAARRMLSVEEKKANALFLKCCAHEWKRAQLQVVEHLEAKMETFHAVPEKKRNGRTTSEQEIHVLTSLGVKRMMKWLEEDQSAIADAKEEEIKSKTEGGIAAHNGWVKARDRLRIRMPTSTENTTGPNSRYKPPPRMDFSSGKGVVRQKIVSLPSTTVERMQHSGLKYVHATMGDLDKSKHLLVKSGYIHKENFDQSSGGGRYGGYDDDGDDNPFSKDRYHFEKQHNATLKKQKQGEKQRQQQRKERYEAWIAHKALKDKAIKYLGHIAKPLETLPSTKEAKEAADDGYEDEFEADDEEGIASAEARWEQVGKALKAVDRGLLDEWMKWSEGFASTAKCRMMWESYVPIACDVHCTSSAIRDVFLKLLHRKDVNYKAAFLVHCDRKLKKAMARGEDEDVSDDLSDEAKMEKYAQLNKAEFGRVLNDLGILLQPEDLQRVMEYFDTDGNQLVSIKEFLDVMGEERGSSSRRGAGPGDTDLILKHVCAWETVCHECGMLNAFQLVIGNTKPGEPRMRSELPGHIKRREKGGGKTRFSCEPECDMHALKKIAPKQCQYSTWTDEQQGMPALKKLELWSAQQREQHVLQKLVTEGSPPAAPTMFRDDDETLDPTTTILIRWQPPRLQGNNGAAFYLLETIGAEGTTSFRLNEYKEIYRDPRDFKDNNGQPRYHYVVTGLQPNTKYGFRVRALNGFGAGPHTFAYFFTAPSTPPAPLAIKITANMIQLGWESSTYYRRQLRELRQVFEEADSDGNGQISRDEFMEEIERRKPRLLEFLQRTNAAEVNNGVVRNGAPLSVFDAIETDDNECISWEEFMKFFHGMLMNDEMEVKKGDDTASSRSKTTTKTTGRPSVKGTASTTSSIASCRYILKQCVNEGAGEYAEIYRGQKATFTVHGLASGSTYQFRVQAYNEEEMYSLHSEPVVVNTLLQTPQPPTVVEMACTCTSVKLKWPTADARPCLSHQAIQAQGRPKSTNATTKGIANGDEITRILKEWAQETSMDDNTIDYRAKFDRYDVDKSNYIELPELKTLLEELGVPATPERMATYMAEFDTDGDGKISFENFKDWWTRSDVQYVLKRDDRKAGTTSDNDAATSYPMNVVCYRGKETVTTIHGLEPNTEYRFRLRTVSSHSSSQLSDALVVCTPPQAPSCPGVISILSTGAYLCWYPGLHGAHKFIVEYKFIETLPSADSGGVTARRPAGSGEWMRGYEGSETLLSLTDLVPNSVYRVRVFAVNRLGFKSEQSTVAQFATLTKDEERRSGVGTLRPSNAADYFTIECSGEGDLVQGDTILFSERLLRNDKGKVVSESECNVSTRGMSDVASVYSVASTTVGSGEPIGERTVAARVVSVRLQEGRHSGNNIHMVVVWSTLQLYDEIGGKKKSATASVSSRSARINTSIHTTSHILATTSSNGYALASDLKIARKEKALYRYDVFRKEWHDERARSPNTWEK